MKNKVSVLLSVVLILTVLCASSSYPVQGAGTSKISSVLQSTLHQMSAGEKTNVYLEINSGILFDDAFNATMEQKTLEQMGLDAVPEWHVDPQGRHLFEVQVNKLSQETYEKNARDLLRLLNVSEEDNISFGGGLVRWRLTAEQIYLASEQEYVRLISSYSPIKSEIFDPNHLLSDPLMNCIAQEAAKECESLSTDEIEIAYRIPLEKGIVTRFEVYNGDYMLPETAVYAHYHNFLMWDSGYPSPSFFIEEENRIIGLNQAYRMGYVSYNEILQLAQNGQTCLYLTGDANLDRKVNINDVTMIQRALAESSTQNHWNNPEQLTGDVDVNQKIEIHDATLIQQYLAEYIAGF